jgi:hypothetical protein
VNVKCKYSTIEWSISGYQEHVLTSQVGSGVSKLGPWKLTFHFKGKLLKL